METIVVEGRSFCVETDYAAKLLHAARNARGQGDMAAYRALMGEAVAAEDRGESFSTIRVGLRSYVVNSVDAMGLLYAARDAHEQGDVALSNELRGRALARETAVEKTLRAYQ